MSEFPPELMADGITRRFVPAIAGCLNPLIAVFAMFASSITVTGNTLRISRPRDPEPAMLASPGVLGQS